MYFKIIATISISSWYITPRERERERGREREGKKVNNMSLSKG